MTWAAIIFYMLAGVAVLSALAMVAAKNPVHSAVFLIITFFNVAGIFIMLGAEFLAAVQVIVYAGAILVLVLFVLMLVDPDDLPEFHTARPVQRNVGILIGLILLLEVTLAIISRTVIGTPGGGVEMGYPAYPEFIDALGGNTQAVGHLLYGQYVLVVEVISLVLLVGVIGAIVLALPDRLGEKTGQRRGTISLGHARGVDLALPSGPRGESPIAEPTPNANPRDLIKTRSADEYTTVGR
ncbi:MAG: NADH-quinone oxidoreductase subunit J [Chloroflexota bacterium]